MSIAKVPLRTLLCYFGQTPERRLASVRADARSEVRKSRGGPSSNGGDFHSCFWADAKSFAATGKDLIETTNQRISDLDARTRLYPLLADGFLSWWTEKRRWINEEIAVIPQAVKAPYSFKEIDGVIKVENLLCLRVGGTNERLIYPYFSEKPILRPEIARLGLWLMGQAFPDKKIEDMRILDVLRGEPFSTDRHPLNGTEGPQFVERYARMLSDWRQFIKEFS